MARTATFFGKLRTLTVGQASLVGTVIIVLAAYGAMLLSYAWLGETVRDLKQPALNGNSTNVVLIQLQDLQTSDGILTTRVQLQPHQALMADQTEGLSSNVSLLVTTRESVLDEMDFEKGNVPGAATIALPTSGQPENWPFDSYVTDGLNVRLFVDQPSGGRVAVPVRVAVSGHIDGWDITSTGDVLASEDELLTITLQRSRGTLAFDLGICLVLVSLPALALFVAIETVRDRRQFLPPLTTWFGAMLFAVVPIRNFLPGAPPVGAWIDQVMVLWVLVALVVAMVIYITAWWRQTK